MRRDPNIPIAIICPILVFLPLAKTRFLGCAQGNDIYDTFTARNGQIRPEVNGMTSELKAPGYIINSSLAFPGVWLIGDTVKP